MQLILSISDDISGLVARAGKSPPFFPALCPTSPEPCGAYVLRVAARVGADEVCRNGAAQARGRCCVPSHRILSPPICTGVFVSPFCIAPLAPGDTHLNGGHGIIEVNRLHWIYRREASFLHLNEVLSILAPIVAAMGSLAYGFSPRYWARWPIILQGG